MKDPYMTARERRVQVESYRHALVHIEIDRPIGYIHHKGGYDLVYPINYGYIPGVLGGDGEELDVYLIGVERPVREFDCEIIGAVFRSDDVEDKLIGVPKGMHLTADEAAAAVAFQESHHDSHVEIWD